MGAGLAKEFKEKFPILEETYKESCRQRQFCSGAKGVKSPYGDSHEILVSESRALFEGNLFLLGANPDMNRPAILCFPTKRDWKDPSDLSLIELGLKTFAQNYKHFNIKSITFPKLGCGLGGLDWKKDVKPLMQKYLGNLPDLNVQICGDTLREDKREHFMSGARGMLPTQFEIPPTRKSEKIHQSEKPLMLLEEILGYVTLPGETALDQFAGSGVLGEASLKTGRNSILIEKDAESFQKMTHRIQALGTIQAVTPAAQKLLSIGKDALVARDAFERTGDRDILTNFVNSHEIHPEILLEGQSDICHNKTTTKDQQDAAVTAFEAIEELNLRTNDPEHANGPQIPQGEHISEDITQRHTPKVLECSSRGDRRFSALFATVKIKGKEQSIEEWYQNAKRTADGKKAGKEKPFDYIIDPFTGDRLPASEATSLYQGLWVTYLSNNPDLVAYAKGFDEFHDMFKRENTVNCQADVIAAYIQDESSFVDGVKASAWYQNMFRKLKHPKPCLQEQIIAASEKRDVQNSVQLSMFGQTQNHPSGNIISGR